MLLIRKFISKFPNIGKTEQKGTPTYYRKRSFNDSELNINDTIKNQFNVLRVVNNKKWPAFIRIKNRIYKLEINNSSIEELLDLKIRVCKFKDSKEIWSIRNNTLTRKMFLTQHHIKWEDHRNWFKAIMSIKSSKIFIAYSKSTEEIVGYIRFDIKNKKDYYISISLKNSFRGFGISKNFIFKAIKKIKVNDVKFIAEIFTHNKISTAVFKQLGFKKLKTIKSLSIFMAYKEEILKNEINWKKND